MTVQTKYFIETADILAVRFECLHCMASVTVAVSREFSVETLGNCPNCRRAWLSLPDNSITGTVKECVGAIDKMVATLRDWKNTMKAVHEPGFAFSLEIREAASPGPAA